MNENMRNNARNLGERYGLEVVEPETMLARFRRSGWTGNQHRNGIRLYWYGQPASACGNLPSPSTIEKREGWLVASKWAFENGVTTPERIAVEKAWVRSHEVRPVRKDRPRGES
jgi:hypothetical protein